MTGFEPSGGWHLQEGLSCFCRIFAPSTQCKYDFIPFTSHRWASTWNLRICLITLFAVPSKTEHRIQSGIGVTGVTGVI